MKSTERPRSCSGAHGGEDPLGKIGRQRRRDLVEQQELWVADERAGQVDHAQHRQRHVSCLLGEVDGQVEGVQLALHRRRRDAREAHVLRDRQIGHESRVLEDGRKPDPRGLGGRADPHRFAVHRDGAAVGGDHPGEDLDERALAGAVRTEERVDLARLDDEIGRPQRVDGPIALREVARFEKWNGRGHEKNDAGEGGCPLPHSIATGPCRPSVEPWCTSSTA